MTAARSGVTVDQLRSQALTAASHEARALAVSELIARHNRERDRVLELEQRLSEATARREQLEAWGRQAEAHQAATEAARRADLEDHSRAIAEARGRTERALDELDVALEAIDTIEGHKPEPQKGTAHG